MNDSSFDPTNIQLAADGIGRSDAKLVAACRKGDPAAWDALVERYQRLIISIPRRAGLNEEQASDVFQEVFLTLLQKLDQIEQPERIRSWIVTTAKFKTWGLIRNQAGLNNAASDDDLETELANYADKGPLADAMLIELEQQHLIRTALASLDERCRTILSMIYMQTTPASYVEVAEAIGTGETSISPLRSRCLKKLQKILIT